MVAAADTSEVIIRADSAVDNILRDNQCRRSNVAYVGQLIENISLIACDSGATGEEVAFATALTLGKLMRDIPELSDQLEKDLVQERVARATPDDLARIRACADALVEEAERRAA